MMKHIVSIEQCDEQDILRILDRAALFEANPNRHLMDGMVGATLFFEPSTRTRLSFETAVNRLGGRVIGFSDPKSSSSTKGESLKDTLLIVSNYADVIIMRHYLEGAALYATEVSPVPIVNAGDGANQHPSQTLLDLYTIRSTQGTLQDLHIVMVGDLRFGRTIHSLIEGMRFFSPRFTFVAPPELRLPEEYRQYCDEHHLRYEETSLFTPEVIADADILYMTRVQRERFTDMEEYTYLIRRCYKALKTICASSTPYHVSMRLRPMWIAVLRRSTFARHKTGSTYVSRYSVRYSV